MAKSLVPVAPRLAGMMTFDELVAEAEAAPIEGWDV
jgi:hypothetical protein